MLAISVSRLNLNLDAELSQALSTQSPPSSPGSDTAWEGCTVLTQPNAIAAGTPSQDLGEVSHPTSEQNARDRRLRRAGRSFAVFPMALTGRGRSNTTFRLLSQTPPTTPMESSHNRGRRVSIESSILPLCILPDDPHAMPASCMARRLSSPPFSSHYEPENRSAPIHANATTASPSVSLQKLEGELKMADVHIGVGNQNEPRPIARQEIIEGPPSQKQTVAPFAISPRGQRAFSIVKEHEVEDDEDDNYKYVDMFHDIEASANAGVSASARIRTSVEEMSTRNDRSISFSADMHRLYDCADVMENQYSTVHKKDSRGSENRRDNRNIRGGGGLGPDKNEPLIDGLVQATEDANYRFSLDSFVSSPQDMYTSDNVPRDRTESPTRAENLTHRQHTYLFQSTIFAGLRVLLFVVITGKLLQWLEASAEWEEVHTIEEVREELKRELWHIVFGRDCLSASETNSLSASTAGAVSGGWSGSSDSTSAASSAACESMKKKFERYLAEWVGRLEESVEHLLKHKYARDYDHLNWTFSNALYVMWTVITTIGYGHMAPATTAGRAFVVVASLLGIPMFIDLATRFANEFLAVCSALRSFLLPHKHLLVVEQLRHRDAVESGVVTRDSGRDRCSLQSARNPEENGIEPKPVAASVSREEQDGQPEGQHQQEEKAPSPRMPLWMVFSVVPAFTAFLAALYMASENAGAPSSHGGGGGGGGWSFWDAFYFTHITLTTVGFGDMVPGGPVWATLLLCFPTTLGVGLYALCFETVQLTKLRLYHWLNARLKRWAHPMLNRVHEVSWCLLSFGRTLPPASSLSFLRNRQHHILPHSMLASSRHFSRISIPDEDSDWESEISIDARPPAPLIQSSGPLKTIEEVSRIEEEEQTKYERWYQQYYKRRDRQATNGHPAGASVLDDASSKSNGINSQLRQTRQSHNRLAQVLSIKQN